MTAKSKKDFQDERVVFIGTKVGCLTIPLSVQIRRVVTLLLIDIQSLLDCILL